MVLTPSNTAVIPARPRPHPSALTPPFMTHVQVTTNVQPVQLVGEVHKRVLVRLLVVTMDTVEGKDVVASVPANPVHQDHDALAAVALPGTHAPPL